MFNAPKVDSRRKVRSAVEIMELVIKSCCPENAHRDSALVLLMDLTTQAELAIDEQA